MLWPGDKAKERLKHKNKTGCGDFIEGSGKQKSP
jgi:hypothetical protein